MALSLIVQFLIIIQLSGLLQAMDQSSWDSTTHHDYRTIQITKVSVTHQDNLTDNSAGVTETSQNIMKEEIREISVTDKDNVTEHDNVTDQDSVTVRDRVTDLDNMTDQDNVTDKDSMTHQDIVTNQDNVTDQDCVIVGDRVTDLDSMTHQDIVTNQDNVIVQESVTAQDKVTDDSTDPNVIQQKKGSCLKQEQDTKIVMITDHDLTDLKEEATKLHYLLLTYHETEVTLTDKVSRIAHDLRHFTTMETVTVGRNDIKEIAADNNPTDVISQETKELASNIMFIGALPVLLLAGIPGNILSVAVFIRQGLRQKVNLLFFSLALADLTFLLVLTMNSVSYLVSLLDATKLFPSLQYAELMYTANTLFLISSLILTTISLDRCLTFTLSLGTRQMSWTQALVCIVILTSVVITASTPAALSVETGFGRNPLTNKTFFYKKPTKLAQILPTDFLNLTDMIFKIICIIIVLLCSVLTSGKMCQATRFRSQSASTVNRDEMKIIKMIIVLCVMFVLCEIPDVVLISFVAAGSEFNYNGSQFKSFTLMFNISFLTKLCNSSANFFVYCIMGSRFRRTLLELTPRLRAVLIERGQAVTK